MLTVEQLHATALRYFHAHDVLEEATQLRIQDFGTLTLSQCGDFAFVAELRVASRPEVVYRRSHALLSTDDFEAFLDAHAANVALLNGCSRAEDAIIQEVKHRFYRRVRDLVRQTIDHTLRTLPDEVALLEGARPNLSRATIAVGLQQALMDTSSWH